MKRARATTINPAMVTTIALRLLILANLRVPAKAGCASNTVVEPLMRASVVCGRMLVSISPDVFGDSRAGVESLLADKESVTRGVPSARQKASVSSGSTRLQAGQRFIFGVLRVLAAFIFWPSSG